MGKSSIQRKAGNTEEEANRFLIYERARLQKQFDELTVELNGDAPVEKLRRMYRDWQDGESEHEAVTDFGGIEAVSARQALMMEVERMTNPLPDPRDPSQPIYSERDQRILDEAEALLEGKHHWEEWVTERKLTSAKVSPVVEKRHRTVLEKFVSWSEIEHPDRATRKHAAEYKRFLLTRINHNGKTSKQSTVAKDIRDLSAWWSWAVRNDWASKNIWLELAKGLEGSEMKPLPEASVVDEADAKATNSGDLMYLIQRYTGCRKQAVAGLRGQDINLENKTISFKQYKEEGRVRKLKEGLELCIPIHSKLLPHIEKAVEKGLPQGAIWPEQYKPSEETWGDRYADRFPDIYGFTSHDLRRIAETDMAKKNISPYITYYVTGHRLPGMSKVTERYVRPTVEDLRQAVEAIAAD